MRVEETAFAKINLALRVVGWRDDGYHLLDSLVVFADVGERIIANGSDRFGFHATGPMATAIDCSADNNLVVQAAQVLRGSFSQENEAPNADLTLVKTIPVAAGLGGGSADAAAALRALNRMWSMGLSLQQLIELARPLGADVPMCLSSRPQRVRGIGDITKGIVLDFPVEIVLANPGMPVATAEVFRANKNRTPAGLGDLPDRFRAVNDLADWLIGAGNDLEAAARTICPGIGPLLDAMHGQPDCLYAGMSGSGASCIGVFPTKSNAESATASLANHNPDWWCRAATCAISSTG